MDEEEFINDLTQQTYLVSKLANGKFERFTTGLKYLIIGSISLIVLLFLGSFLFPATVTENSLDIFRAYKNATVHETTIENSNFNRQDITENIPLQDDLNE